MPTNNRRRQRTIALPHEDRAAARPTSHHNTLLTAKPTEDNSAETDRPQTSKLLAIKTADPIQTHLPVFERTHDGIDQLRRPLVEPVYIARQLAADRNSVSVQTIDKMIRTGKLPAYYLGRAVRVKLSELDEVIRSSKGGSKQ